MSSVPPPHVRKNPATRYAFATDAMRYAFKARSRMLSLRELATRSGIISPSNVSPLLYSWFRSHEVNVGRVEKLADALGVPREQSWEFVLQEDIDARSCNFDRPTPKGAASRVVNRGDGNFETIPPTPEAQARHDARRAREAAARRTRR
jgi:hypothetical protein